VSARVRITEGYDGRLYVKWWIDDSALFRRVKEDFKDRFSRDVGRDYDDTTKTWSVPKAYYTRLCSWLDRWFDSDEQDWGEDEPAGRGYGRTYSDTRSSYERYGKGQASTSAIEAAFATLHLLPSAPPELVQAAHRTLVKIHHPDVAGGDGHRMVQINLALERIRAHQEEKAS
jgi:hypothetical protein